MKTPEERRAYYRNYYATHPEQRIKRNQRARKWQKEHSREWNMYQSEYSYCKRNGIEFKKRRNTNEQDHSDGQIDTRS